MAAPRPIPTQLKIARGNPGKRRLNKDEPMPLPGEPERPDSLSPEALAWWNYYVPMLLRMKVLTEAEKVALARLSDLSAKLDEASNMVKKFGLMIKRQVYNRNGEKVVCEGVPITVPVANPAFKMQIELEKQVKSYLLEFGLTPASRTKVTKAVQPQQLQRDILGELRERAKRSRRSTL